MSESSSQVGLSKGREIESQSFSIIRDRLRKVLPSGPEGEVILRVIHATADFDFASSLRFHPQAISSGLQALKTRAPVFCDVRMVEAGIAPSARTLGIKTACFIDDLQVIARAKAQGVTRAEAAVEVASEKSWGIWIVGNAPTALLKTIELIKSGRLRVDLVVGTPVGFVDAARAKAILNQQDFPFITSLGEKGGSPVAVAIVNALIRLAR
ncbi:precorrin-8X methylmutase [Thermosulfuriphilus sp.]